MTGFEGRIDLNGSKKSFWDNQSSLNGSKKYFEPAQCSNTPQKAFKGRILPNSTEKMHTC
jgi:hypothetical protein